MSIYYYLANTMNPSLITQFTGSKVIFLLLIYISLCIVTFVCVHVRGPCFNILRFPGKCWGEDRQNNSSEIKDLCLFLASVLPKACLASWNVRVVLFTNVFLLCFLIWDGHGNKCQHYKRKAEAVVVPTGTRNIGNLSRKSYIHITSPILQYQDVWLIQIKFG